MRRATVFICVAQLIAASAALPQSRPAKDLMSWRDILNKAGPPPPATQQHDPARVPEPGEDIFGPNPLRTPADNPRIGPTEQSQHEQRTHGGELRVVNVKEND